MTAKARTQRGGTFAGLILGVVIGLGIALAVAAYVNKVPVPFLSSGSRLADQDAREAARNKNWNPNAGLIGNGTAAKPPTANSTPESPPTPAVTGEAASAAAPTSSDPLGDLARARAQGATTAAETAPAAAAGSGYNYFIQAGAFRAPDEADAQRAQLAMLGWDARVSEGQQNGRSVYRVRIGPFARRDDAEQLKGKLDDAGINAILVRVGTGAAASASR